MDINLELLKTLWCDDFNRGYFVAVLIIVAFLVIWSLLRLILVILFRTRRCSVITVPRKDGDLIISSVAVTDAVRQELKSFPQLGAGKIQLYRNKTIYSMMLFCTFDSSSSVGLPELTDQLKPKIQEMLKNTFGIDNLKKIKIKVESWSYSESGIVNSAESQPAGTDLDN